MLNESNLTIFTRMLENLGIEFRYEDSFIPIKVTVSPETSFSITFIFDEDDGELIGVEKQKNKTLI